MQPLEPGILTIFGITGDLARRKLLPALYELANQKVLPDDFKIVGISRRGTTVDDVIQTIEQDLHKIEQQVDPATIAWLRQAITIVAMDMTKPEEYSRLKSELDIVEKNVGTCLHRLFYLAIPSSLFTSVIRRLGESDLNNGCQHGETESRLLIEKPFGYDLESAKELIATIHASFTDEQVYRIDHYLAKETVQNILTFRFNNPLFSGAWNKEYISHIMITAAESIGIEGRVPFYDHMGALRDLIQSHLLQILALVTMNKPASMSAADIHTAKEHLMEHIIPPSADKIASQTVRGQYESYDAETGHTHSQTETYAAVRLTIDTDEWAGVPMYIRTGKSLADKATEVTVVFTDPNDGDTKNYLTIRIQPNEGIVLNLHIKKPGYEKETEDVDMDFCYQENFGVTAPSAYERVFVDALRGDKSLFATAPEILASWQITEPILQSWQTNQQPLISYPNGSWGPAEAQDLLEEVSGKWLTSSLHVCRVHSNTKKPRGGSGANTTH